MRRRSERGNTMIELLAATIIIGIISFALTESLVSGLNNTGDTQERLTGSIDRQRVASAFVPDAQSATTMDQAQAVCGEDASTPDEVVGNLRWTDGEVDNVASYLDLDSKLVRRFCSVDGDTPVEDSQVLVDLDDEADATIDDSEGRFVLEVCVRTDCTKPPSYEVVVRPKVDP